MERTPSTSVGFRRREFLQGAIFTAAAAGGAFVNTSTRAEMSALGGYNAVRINWRQAEGELVRVALPRGACFDELISIKSQFESLTGVVLRIERLDLHHLVQSMRSRSVADRKSLSTLAIPSAWLSYFDSNGWLDDLSHYLVDASLTDQQWYDFNDIISVWREANTVRGSVLAIPYDGQLMVHAYRADLYDTHGLKPSFSYCHLHDNAKGLTDARLGAYGLAPLDSTSIFSAFASRLRGYGGSLIADEGINISTSEAIAALMNLVRACDFAPSDAKGVTAGQALGRFLDGSCATYVGVLPSGNSVGTEVNRSPHCENISFAPLPSGPAGITASPAHNWSLSISSMLPEKERIAAWLFVKWATCAETQMRTSRGHQGQVNRVGPNRLSLWKSEQFIEVTKGVGLNFAQSSLETLQQNADDQLIPKSPQWPFIQNEIASACRSALSRRKDPSQALVEAQARINLIAEQSNGSASRSVVAAADYL